SKGAVRVVLTRAGLEVDVLLQEQFPAPPSAYGLNEASARAEVLTELYQSPAPVKSPHTLQPRRDAAGRQLGAPLTDNRLQFGTMMMQPGHAFSTSDGVAFPRSTLDGSVPVGKSVETLGGRQFLIEAVRWQDIRPHLDKLPPSSIQSPTNAALGTTLRSASVG